jgi:hypothetical protein
MLLLLAATEIFACDTIASPVCVFSSHSTKDSDDGCSADGCLCCCAHIVVVQPVLPLAPLGLIAGMTVFEDPQTAVVPPKRIEHPPRS